MARFTPIDRILNLFGFSSRAPSGMHSDAPVSQQPEGTYRNAWGVSNQNTDEEGGGVYNMNGMGHCGSLPNGHYPRGHHFAEEKDLHIYFTVTEGGFSQIGYIDPNTCEYTKVISDDDIDGCGFGFSMDEWITIESKYMRNGTCKELNLYWSNNKFLKTINFDNPFKNCPPPLACEEVTLLKCFAGPTPKARSSETGGSDLEGGVYQYLVKFEDTDGNETNYFQVSDPIALETPNNLPGEFSEQAIHIQLNNLSPQYNKVDIALIKTVGGRQTAHQLTDDLFYTTDGIEFLHRSQSQELFDLDIEEIFAKKNQWFRTDNVFQFDRQLFPYQNYDEANVNWQDLVDKIKINYRVVGVPIEQAHLVKGLRADEVYGIGVVGNHCDGTRTRSWHKKGREATAFDRDIIEPGADNCLECPVERWKVENTAKRTEVICDDPRGIADREEDILYDTGDPIYVENPDDEDPLGDDDAGGIPTEDTFKEAQNQQLRQLECICKRLAKVFKLLDRVLSGGLLDFTISPAMRRHLLSDPVAIATAWCMCEELANQGGVNDDEPEEQLCDCCDLCGNPDTAEDCNCCDACDDAWQGGGPSEGGEGDPDLPDEP